MSKLGEIINRAAGGPPSQPAPPSPLAAVWQTMSAVVQRLVAIEQRPEPRDGNDGTGIAELIIDARGHLIATLTTGAIKDVGKIPVAHGKDADPAEIAALRDEVRALGETVAALADQPRDAAPIDIEPLARRIDEIAAVAEGAARSASSIVIPEAPAALVSVHVNAAGELIHIFSDGREKNLGTVVGAAGDKIVDAQVGDDGRLTILLNDGRRLDAGLVRGEDGHSVSTDEVRRLVDAAVASLPAAEPGKDADPALVERLVQDKVAAAIAGLPEPKPGKDADMQAVREFIANEVAGLPKPNDGHTPTAEEIRPLIAAEVATAVAALPEPAPGQDVDMDVVKATIAEEVKAAVASIDKPKDGNSVTVADVAPLIEQEVAKAVSGLPAPKDGVSIVDLIVDGAGHLQVVMSDARRVDAGLVVPEAIAGPPGKSVDAATVNEDGDLILTMSDGQEINAGYVVGKPGDTVKGDPGRGIADLTIADGCLHAAFSDGAKVNLGRVEGRPGKPGKTIAAAKPAPSIVFDESRPADLSSADIANLRIVTVIDNDGVERRMLTLD